MIKQIFFSILIVLLGLFFLFSGLVKLFPIEPFEYNFVEQGFMGWHTASIAARLIISFEIFLGLLLILHQHLQKTLKLIIGLLSFFTIYLLYAIIKDGNNGNCGCFGTYFQMTPLESIIKNISLIAVSYLLIQINVKGQFKNKWLVIFSLIISVSIPLAINPPDMFVISTYDFGKLNYELKAEALEKLESEKIDNNWKKGKKVLAFLSTTCPHCRNMAFKLHILKNHHPNFNIYFIYGGKPENRKDFVERAKCADMPSIDLTIDEMVKIVGPVFPVVMGVDDGKVTKKWNLVSLSDSELNNFFR
jgi:uncharacterized membrane protein YphA (DoxX/SURF4 family)